MNRQLNPPAIPLSRTLIAVLHKIGQLPVSPAPHLNTCCQHILPPFPACLAASWVLQRRRAPSSPATAHRNTTGGSNWCKPTMQMLLRVVGSPGMCTIGADCPIGRALGYLVVVLARATSADGISS